MNPKAIKQSPSEAYSGHAVSDAFLIRMKSPRTVGKSTADCVQIKLRNEPIRTEAKAAA